MYLPTFGMQLLTYSWYVVTYLQLVCSYLPTVGMQILTYSSYVVTYLQLVCGYLPTVGMYVLTLIGTVYTGSSGYSSLSIRLLTVTLLMKVPLLFNNGERLSQFLGSTQHTVTQRTLTMSVGVVALHYQHQSVTTPTNIVKVY